MAKSVGEMIRERWKNGDYLGWFEDVYQHMERPPWTLFEPYPYLITWLEREKPNTEGKRALVVGCGLGDDAEYLAALGYQVTAFDISETAIQKCKSRFPETQVAYQVADLLQAPSDWQGAFDFIYECRTLQSMPYTLFEKGCQAITDCLAPDGILLLLCFGREQSEVRQGIPWAIAREELAIFQVQGLSEISFAEHQEQGHREFELVYQKST